LDLGERIGRQLSLGGFRVGVRLFEIAEHNDVLVVEWEKPA
jgi:hypothetical protein